MDMKDLKEGWALKNWCFWTEVLEKTLKSPLDSKGIKPVNPKVNQPQIFIGTTDAVGWSSNNCPPDTMSWHIGKDLDAGKDRGQEEKGATEDEMDWWHHWLNGHDWAYPGRCWRTGKPSALQSMGSQKRWTWLSNSRTTIIKKTWTPLSIIKDI